MNNFFQDSWLKFNRSSIKVLVGMLILLVGLSTTMAWFTDSDNFSTDTDTGTIFVDLHCEINQMDMVAPNRIYRLDEMVYVIGRTETDVSDDTADAYVRIKYTAFIGSDDVTHLITPIFYNNADYLLNGHDTWIYSETDGKYYYLGYTNTTTKAVFCDGFMVSQNFPKAFQNKTVIFKIEVDAIQRKYKAYVDDPDWAGQYPESWANYLTTYNFEIDPETEPYE